MKNTWFVARLLAVTIGGITASPAESPAAGSLPSPAEWTAQGNKIWALAAEAKEMPITGSDGRPHRIPVVGVVDFTQPGAEKKVEIEAQMIPEFRNAEGETIRDDLREMTDPIHGTNASQSGGSFMARPLPLDHDAEGKLLGLKILLPANPNSSPYHRIGIRFPGTPAGRLLFLFEMGDENGGETSWHAREYTAPLPGCPWLPPRAAVTGDGRKSHLRKLAVFQLEPWQDPRERIPAKLKREDLKIDLDAAAEGMNWEQLKDWIAKNVNDDLVSPDKPFVIQLPPGRIEDANRLEVAASPYVPWGKAIHNLSEGRKVWLVGHPDTTFPAVILGANNLGLLFSRISRLDQDGAALPTAERYGPVVHLAGNHIDFRNNWVECPDGVADAAVLLRNSREVTILDNVLAASGAGIASAGPDKHTSIIIARNWLERGHDAFQLYGGWEDLVLAYNHVAGASGSANRAAANGHLGANLHSDEIQAQTNLTDLNPQSFRIFSNFFQFGRHNWPAEWSEIGGGTQNFIIDGDSYADSHIYWNLFQNVMPTGHRGIKTIGPDKDWAHEEGPGRNPGNSIENLAIMGNAFLERWDHNNHPPYGYFAPGSSIGGRWGQPLFELLNSENLYATTPGDVMPALFKQVVESRPDPQARAGWRQNVPTLTDIYEHPILFTGSWDGGYQADFSRTAHAGNKLLEGFAEPLDYSPKPGWAGSPGGAARLTPAAELAKIPPMPTDLAAMLGDSSRKGSFFEEFSGPPVRAAKQTMPAPWRESAPNDGFLLHVKFASVGTPGSWREILSETDGNRRYLVALTEANTARFEFYEGDKLLSRVESTDTFKDGDHLTLQVYTPYFPVHAEGHYPMARLNHLYQEGIRRIRYISSAEAPTGFETKPDELLVWMDTSRNYRFFEWRNGEWQMVRNGNDAIHGSSIRSFSDNRGKEYNANLTSTEIGTAENFRRDLYPIEAGRWHTLHLDGPDGDSRETWQPNDLRWTSPIREQRYIFRNDNGKQVGAGAGLASLSTGRPRCFIRHNVDHQDKRFDWIWTPDVDLPRGEVTLFGSFDGAYETFRVIRGGQGEYGLPANHPSYRMLESMASALAFIRPPLDASGKVPGWGTPDIFLKHP